MHAFVGADRDRPPDARQRLVVGGRQRLLDQRHAGRGTGGKVLFEIVGCPCFVRIDDQFGFGGGLAHRRDPRTIAVAAELDLEQRPVCGLGGRRRHRLRRPQRNRERGGAGVRGGPAEQGPGPFAPDFGLEVDQRAVQRVPGSPRGHGGLQGRSVQSFGQRLLHRHKGGQRRFRGLAVTGVGHAFAAPGPPAMGDFGHDGDRFGLGAAADREGTGDRPAFDSGGKLSGFAGSHFKILQFLNRELARRNQLWLVRDRLYKAMRRAGSHLLYR